jgi:hypothetical protein
MAASCKPPLVVDVGSNVRRLDRAILNGQYRFPIIALVPGALTPGDDERPVDSVHDNVSVVRKTLLSFIESCIIPAGTVFVSVHVAMHHEEPEIEALAQVLLQGCRYYAYCLDFKDPFVRASEISQRSQVDKAEYCRRKARAAWNDEEFDEDPPKIVETDGSKCLLLKREEFFGGVEYLTETQVPGNSNLVHTIGAPFALKRFRAAGHWWEFVQKATGDQHASVYVLQRDYGDRPAPRIMEATREMWLLRPPRWWWFWTRAAHIFWQNRRLGRHALWPWPFTPGLFVQRGVLPSELVWYDTERSAAASFELLNRTTEPTQLDRNRAALVTLREFTSAPAMMRLVAARGVADRAATGDDPGPDRTPGNVWREVIGWLCLFLLIWFPLGLVLPLFLAMGIRRCVRPRADPDRTVIRDTCVRMDEPEMWLKVRRCDDPWSELAEESKQLFLRIVDEVPFRNFGEVHGSKLRVFATVNGYLPYHYGTCECNLLAATMKRMNLQPTFTPDHALYVTLQKWFVSLFEKRLEELDPRDWKEQSPAEYARGLQPRQKRTLQAYLAKNKPLPEFDSIYRKELSERITRGGCFAKADFTKEGKFPRFIFNLTDAAKAAFGPFIKMSGVIWKTLANGVTPWLDRYPNITILDPGREPEELDRILTQANVNFSYIFDVSQCELSHSDASLNLAYVIMACIAEFVGAGRWWRVPTVVFCDELFQFVTGRFGVFFKVAYSIWAWFWSGLQRFLGRKDELYMGKRSHLPSGISHTGFANTVVLAAIALRAVVKYLQEKDGYLQMRILLVVKGDDISVLCERQLTGDFAGWFVRRFNRYGFKLEFVGRAELDGDASLLYETLGGYYHKDPEGVLRLYPNPERALVHMLVTAFAGQQDPGKEHIREKLRARAGFQVLPLLSEAIKPYASVAVGDEFSITRRANVVDVPPSFREAYVRSRGISMPELARIEVDVALGLTSGTIRNDWLCQRLVNEGYLKTSRR